MHVCPYWCFNRQTSVLPSRLLRYWFHMNHTDRHMDNLRTRSLWLQLCTKLSHTDNKMNRLFTHCCCIFLHSLMLYFYLSCLCSGLLM